MGLLFLVVRAAGALHGESVPEKPSRPAARPQARSGLSAGSLHTRGEKGRHVQRWEVQGGKPLVKRRQEEQEAIARVQVRLRRASPPAACQGPAQRTGRSGDEANSRVPSDEAALCTEELWQRQGAGKGGGALGRAQGIRGGGCRGRARPRSPARAHASPPHLRGGGFPESQWRGTQAASPTPAHVCLGQSGGGQLRHSWVALPRSRARLCAAAEERERSWGAANVGLGTLCLLRDSSGWLWEALLRRDWVFWVSSLHHISCSRCSKSPALFFFFYGCVVQGCRRLC